MKFVMVVTSPKYKTNTPFFEEPYMECKEVYGPFTDTYLERALEAIWKSQPYVKAVVFDGEEVNQP